MCNIDSIRKGECLDKLAQLITMHSEDFHTNDVQSKGWLSAMVGNDLELIFGLTLSNIL